LPSSTITRKVLEQEVLKRFSRQSKMNSAPPGGAHGDQLSELPTSNSTASPNEKILVDHIFGTKNSDIIEHFKNPLLVAGLVGFFLLPQVDELFRRLIPSIKESVYVGILVKMITAAIIFYFVSNWSSVRV
jgi:hypothetical protein